MEISRRNYMLIFMGLRNQTVSGLRWIFWGQIFQRPMDLVFSIFLARILVPEDFGLVGIATFFINLVRIVMQSWFEAFVIRNTGLSVKEAFELTGYSGVVGMIIAILYFLSAPLVADFFGSKNLELIVLSMSPAIIFVSIIQVPAALLRAKMDFRTQTLITLGSTYFGGGLALFLALKGFGFWALVFQSLAMSFIQMVLSLYFTRLVVSWSWSFTLFRRLWDDSKGFLGYNLLNFFSRNIDDMLVGKFVGVADLGIYSRCYYLMMLPINQINGVASSVLMPALSKLSDDIPRLKSRYTEVIRLLALIGFPVVTGLFSVIKPLILTIWGPKWLGVSRPFEILCLVALMQIVTNPTGWVLTALNQGKALLQWGMISSVLIISSFLLGVYFKSVEAVCWSYLSINLILFVPCNLMVCRRLKLSFIQLMAQVLPGVTLSLAIILSVNLAKALISAGTHHALELAILVASGVVSAVTLSFLLFSKDAREILKLAHRKS